MSSLRLISALLLGAGGVACASEVRVWGTTDTAYFSPTVQAQLYTVPAGLTDVVQIAVCQSSIAALRSTGQVVVWGVAGRPSALVPASAQSGVTSISATQWADVFYAIKSDGTVVAWGDNSQLQASVPAGLTHVVRVHGGQINALAVKDDGSVVVWGGLGTGVLTNPSPGLTCTDAFPGVDVGIALKADHSLVAWNDSPSKSAHPLASFPSGLTGVTLFVSGLLNAAVIDSAGTVTAWGDPASGLLSMPAGLTGIAEVAWGLDHAVARSTTGTLTMWGDAPAARPEILSPASLVGCMQVAAGDRFTVALIGATPTDITLSPASVQTGAAAATVIGSLTATDSDSRDTHTFTLVSGAGADDNARFVISGKTVTVGAATLIATAGNPLHIRVKVTDLGGLTYEKSLSLLVTAAPSSDDSSKGFLGGGCGLGGGVSLILAGLLGCWLRLRGR